MGIAALILKCNNKLELAAISPFVILPVLLLVAASSRLLTILIMIVIGMAALYINSRPQQNNRSQFFFSWTISSFVFMILIFESIVLEKMYITALEHVILLCLLTCTCFCFYEMKSVADFVLSKGSSKGKEYSPVLTSDSHYCKICQIEVNEQFFHSIWWDCCVFRTNYRFFLLGHVFAFATLLYGTNIGLTSVCRPFKFYKEILLPDDCDEAYDDYFFAISFVTCVYGVGYLSFVVSVLGRQLFIYIPKYYIKRFFSGRSSKPHYQLVNQLDV